MEPFVGAVTGTNGKTSVVEYTRQILTACGTWTATLGTLGLVVSGEGRDPEPDTIDLVGPAAMPAYIRRLARRGVDAFVFEAYSAAIARGIFDMVEVDVAAFTNITPEHLDVHGDMDSYLRSKAKLFSEVLGDDGTAVLPAGCPEPIVDICRRRGLDVIVHGPRGDIAIVDAQPLGGGTSEVLLEIAGGRYAAEIPLMVGYELFNGLAALGMAFAAGIDVGGALEALSELRRPPGRMQRSTGPGGTEIVVDYAHNPGALAAVLQALRAETDGWLTVVFGCGGDRDVSKREPMGRIASDIADVVVVTDDNPRSEDPAVIRADILSGCADTAHVYEIPGRQRAIDAAIDFAEEGDTVLIAGKGEETGIEVGDRFLPHSDLDAVADSQLWVPS